MDNLASWINTGLVSLVVGYLGYRSTRAGQKTQAKADEAAARVQEASEKRAETQQALDAWKAIAQDRKADNEAKDHRIDELSEQIKTWHQLAWQQIDHSAAVTEQAIPEGPNGSEKIQ